MADAEIDMDGRVLRATSNDANGTVSDATTFRFEQEEDLIQARYEGGEIRRGFLVGQSDGEILDFRYAHLTVEGETATGRSVDEIERLPDGRVRLQEEWAWDSKQGSGTSVLEEIDGSHGTDDRKPHPAPAPSSRMSEERFMRRAIELAREAAERGDNPFGSVLVRDGEIVMEDSNRVVTEDDVRRHPELNLARLAVREQDPEARGETTMYTSTEPCPMCAGGMRYAGFDRVVYATSGPEIAEFTGHDPGVRASEILDGVTEVEGPLCREEALALHEDVW